MNRYSYAGNNAVNYVDPSGNAFFGFHMITEFIGSMFGSLFGSDKNPLDAFSRNWTLDLEGVSKTGDPIVDKERLEVHANSWHESVTMGEALRAGVESFNTSMADRDVTKANHTFYDILTHWGGEFNGRLNDISTWPGAIGHFLFNDIILDTLFLPVALVESAITNVSLAMDGWFPADNGAGGGGVYNGDGGREPIPTESPDML